MKDSEKLKTCIHRVKSSDWREIFLRIKEESRRFADEGKVFLTQNGAKVAANTAVVPMNTSSKMKRVSTSLQIVHRTVCGA